MGPAAAAPPPPSVPIHFPAPAPNGQWRRRRRRQGEGKQSRTEGATDSPGSRQRTGERPHSRRGGASGARLRQRSGGGACSARPAGARDSEQPGWPTPTSPTHHLLPWALPSRKPFQRNDFGSFSSECRQRFHFSPEHLWGSCPGLGSGTCCLGPAWCLPGCPRCLLRALKKAVDSPPHPNDSRSFPPVIPPPPSVGDFISVQNLWGLAQLDIFAALGSPQCTPTPPVIQLFPLSDFSPPSARAPLSPLTMISAPSPQRGHTDCCSCSLNPGSSLLLRLSSPRSSVIRTAWALPPSSLPSSLPCGIFRPFTATLGLLLQPQHPAKVWSQVSLLLWKLSKGGEGPKIGSARSHPS